VVVVDSTIIYNIFKVEGRVLLNPKHYLRVVYGKYIIPKQRQKYRLNDK